MVIVNDKSPCNWIELNLKKLVQIKFVSFANLDSSMHVLVLKISF